MIGTTVSHYRILEELDRGGFGVVYKCEDVRLGRFVAVKFLHEKWSHEGDALKRFRQEARAASALNHPNICTIHDIDQHEGRHFIVMEFLEGATLERHLTAQAGGRGFETETMPLTVDQIVRVGCHTADALGAAHKAGILHRDIKPANIFLTTSGQVKLLDFGLAKFTRKVLAAPDAETLSENLTASGIAVGTIAYMSPEQLEGSQVDAGTDIFSLGTVLYEMVARRHPFLGRSTGSTIANILKEEPPQLADVAPEVPGFLARVIRRCLRKDRGERYGSAGELAIELRSESGSSRAIGDDEPQPELRLSGSAARITFLLIQGGYLALYIATMFYVDEAAAVLDRNFGVPDQVGLPGLIVFALFGIAVRLYLTSGVALDHPEAGVKFRTLFPFLLVLDAAWASAPLLLVDRIGLGLAMAATACLAYVPFSQRTLIRAIYRGDHGL